MTLKSTIVLVFTLYFITLTRAFDIKSILFGGEPSERDSSTSHSESFGTPVQESSFFQSKRSDIACDGYLCEETDACVKKPVDCPCRLETDLKCFVGDWYTCVRGNESCDDLLL